ncbi:MAG: hypothetical protein KAS32_03660, partial [Candidatus Peribacteraceae bacterium]|nr:hypothetical protein [Candidatus Peribacteraceae bacterium]
KEILHEKFPESNPDEFKVVVGEVYTDNDVIIDPRVFESHTYVKRKTLALDMEGYAIAYAAKSLGLDGWLWAKGVQDFAKPADGKDDKPSEYTKFAAYASALFVIEFMRNFFADFLNQTTFTSQNEYGRNNEKYGWEEKDKNIFISSDARRKIIAKKQDRHDSHYLEKEWYKNAFGEHEYELWNAILYENGNETAVPLFCVYNSVYLPLPEVRDNKVFFRRNYCEVGRVMSKCGWDTYNIYIFNTEGIVDE